MKKRIILALFVITNIASFSQDFNYFKSLGYEQVYLGGATYTLHYKTETNFMGKTTSVEYDTIYIQEVLKLNEKMLKRKDLIEKQNNYISKAINYSNMIELDNVNLKSKKSLKTNARIQIYKALLLDAEIRYKEYRDNQLLNLKIKQDSIELCKQKEDSLELSRIKRLEIQADSIKNIDSIKYIIDYSKIVVTHHQPEEIATSGNGNNTFRLSPQMLSGIMIKNPTLKMLEATFPEYNVAANYPEDGIIRYESRYFSFVVAANYSLDRHKINEIIISNCTYVQIKSFKQLLIDYGFRINASSSDLANAITRDTGEYREYYKKGKSPIYYVIISNQIRVLRN